jgi:hypothetical protein
MRPAFLVILAALLGMACTVSCLPETASWASPGTASACVPRPPVPPRWSRLAALACSPALPFAMERPRSSTAMWLSMATSQSAAGRSRRPWHSRTDHAVASTVWKVPRAGSRISASANCRAARPAFPSTPPIQHHRGGRRLPRIHLGIRGPQRAVRQSPHSHGVPRSGKGADGDRDVQLSDSREAARHPRGSLRRSRCDGETVVASRKLTWEDDSAIAEFQQLRQFAPVWRTNVYIIGCEVAADGPCQPMLAPNEKGVMESYCVGWFSGSTGRPGYQLLRKLADAIDAPVHGSTWRLPLDTK